MKKIFQYFHENVDKVINSEQAHGHVEDRSALLAAPLELSYNEANALAANAHAEDPDIWSYPVWWDCATDEEYEGYLK